jgi:hypothetical protein
MARCLNPVQYRHHHTRPGALGAIAVAILLLAGCSGPQGNAVTTPTATPTAIPSAPATAPTATPSATPSVDPGFATLRPLSPPGEAILVAHRQLQTQGRRLVVPTDPVAVDLYTLDPTCEAYRIEPIQVPRAQSMETTVDWILAEQSIPELILSGYRTSFNPDTKTVTIDLRVARNSRRVLQSLSFCEQKALLGSLRETLIHQPDWKIEAVIFTNRGNPLVL